MPQLVYTIDEIARKEQRDVLWVYFDIMNCECSKKRSALIKWLDIHGIRYEKAGSPPSSGWLSYDGGLWIDLPIDKNDEKYRLLCEHMESSDGISRSPGVILYIVTLQYAMKAKSNDCPDSDC